MVSLRSILVSKLLWISHTDISDTNITINKNVFSASLEIWCSSQWPMIGITKAFICAVCGMVHIKYPLLLIKKSSPCSCGSGFPL